VAVNPVTLTLTFSLQGERKVKGKSDLRVNGCRWTTDYCVPNIRPRPWPPRRPLPPPRPRPPTVPSPKPAPRPGATFEFRVVLALPHRPNPRPVLGPSPAGPVLSKPGIWNTSFQSFNRVKNFPVRVSHGGPDLVYASCQYPEGYKNRLES
jgi:hypothetical protein